MKMWVNPKNITHQIFAMDADAIYLATEEQTAAMQAGTPPDEVQRYAFSRIKSVKINEAEGVAERGVTIDVEDRSLDINFDTETMQAEQEIFEALRERLPHLEESQKQYSSVSALAGPGGCLLVLVPIFWLLYKAAGELAVNGPATITGRHQGKKRIFTWLLDVLGPTGVLVLGGLCLLAVISMAVSRFRNPPSWRILKTPK